MKRQNHKKKVFFKTFGCRTNQFDTQVMMSNLVSYELCSNEGDADIVVVNSCTVTNGADSSVRGYINSLSRKSPNIKIILAGCGAQSRGKSFFESRKVFGVIGHSNKEKVDQILQKQERFYEIGNLEHVDSTILEKFIGKSRAFIKIQEGCDFECSYCIIPSVRGAARSHPEHIVLSQIEILSSSGFDEFILTGTNIGSYGKDHGSSIAKLLKKISSIKGVKRIRIGSLEPIQIDDEFLELLNEPWMSRHLHIALQHTSDTMLNIMKRRNSFRSDLELFERVAEAGYALGTDFIIGHPGENENIWKEATKRVKQLPLTHIHAFSYSKRDGTASAEMTDIIRGDIIKARYAELTEIVADKNYQFRRDHDKNLDVLVESRVDDNFSGLDQYFNRIFIKSDKDLTDSWIKLDKIDVAIERNRADIKKKL